MIGILVLAEREAVFNELYAKHLAHLATLPQEEIQVTLPDGSIKSGTAHVTTPYDIAKGISQVI